MSFGDMADAQKKYEEFICLIKSNMDKTFAGVMKRVQKELMDLLDSKDPVFQKLREAHIEASEEIHKCKIDLRGFDEIRTYHEQQVKEVNNLLKNAKKELNSIDTLSSQVKKSNSILFDFYQMRDELANIKSEFGAFKKGLRIAVDEKPKIDLDLPISDFELTRRTQNCLHNANINTVGDLLNIPEEKLLKYRNFGKKSLTEIQELKKKILEDR